jgi:hypothetical protein
MVGLHHRRFKEMQQQRHRILLADSYVAGNILGAIR